MDTLEEKIKKIRLMYMEKVEESARQGKVEGVVALLENGRQIEVVIEKYENLKREVEAMENNYFVGGAEPRPVAEKKTPPSPKEEKKGGNRDKGVAARSRLLLTLSKRGVEAIQVRGAHYQVKRVGLVGIAYASERNPDRWFLGLRDADYSAVIFLCEKGNGDVVNIITPKSFWESYRAKFSRSGDQIKFNIIGRSGNFQMTIPGVGNISLKEFINNFNILDS